MSLPIINWLIVGVTTYLIGSLPFGILVSMAMRLSDPRTYGSKNPGATNVLRSGHKLAAGLTLMGDLCKGAGAIGLAGWFASASYEGRGDAVIALAACSVVVGHLYPVFFHFKGGKGVATAAGVLFAIHPGLGAAVTATWTTVAFFSRYSSLAALISAIFAPLYALGLLGPGLTSAAVATISVLLIIRHGSNIRNLLTGKEDRIGASSMPGSSSETSS